MCGIPDFKIGFKDAECQFFIEMSTPQPQACSRQPRAARPQPDHLVAETDPIMAALGNPQTLTAIAQMAALMFRE